MPSRTRRTACVPSGASTCISASTISCRASLGVFEAYTAPLVVSALPLSQASKTKVLIWFSQNAPTGITLSSLLIVLLSAQCPPKKICRIWTFLLYLQNLSNLPIPLQLTLSYSLIPYFY